jgi:hypothetical protein
MRAKEIFPKTICGIRENKITMIMDSKPTGDIPVTFELVSAESGEQAALLLLVFKVFPDWVNQLIRFPPNICRFPLSAPPPGGSTH